MDTDEVMRANMRGPGRPKAVPLAAREEMRRRYAEDPDVTCTSLASEYKISRNTVWLIVQGDPWVQLTKAKQRIKELEALLGVKQSAKERAEA